MSSMHFAETARSFLAILAGFATMTVLTFLVTIGLRKALPESDQDNATARAMSLKIACNAFFAALGGYVTAMVAGSDPLRNLLMLAIVVLLMAALSALQLRGQQPLSYQFALIVLTPIAALAGGLLRVHFRR